MEWPLHLHSLRGVAIMYLILLLYVECPLQKDSLCGMAIKDSSFGLESGGHHVRIFYVERPLHLHSLCGVAIM